MHRSIIILGSLIMACSSDTSRDLMHSDGSSGSSQVSATSAPASTSGSPTTTSQGNTSEGPSSGFATLGDTSGSSTTESIESSTSDGSTSEPPGKKRVILKQLIAHTNPLPFPLTGNSPTTHFLNVETSIPSAGERLYFYADYNMAGGAISQQFSTLGMSLNRNYCFLSINVDLDPTELVTAPIVDISSGSEVEVPTVPYGGAGDLPSDQGVNVWDITELELYAPKCTGNALQSLDFSSPGPFSLVVYWTYGGHGAVVRSFRLYIGEETND